MKFYRITGTVINSDSVPYYESAGVEFISAKLIYDILEEANGEDITLNLNSGGGDVYSGCEIYTMLQNYAGKVVVNITSLSGSIATIFMLGADEVNISHHAQLFIHCPSFQYLSGELNSQTLEKYKQSISTTEKVMVDVYHKKTGLDKEELLDIMVNETWFTAEEAKEKGFVDNIISFDKGEALDKAQLVAMVNHTTYENKFISQLKQMS